MSKKDHEKGEPEMPSEEIKSPKPNESTDQPDKFQTEDDGPGPSTPPPGRPPHP